MTDFVIYLRCSTGKQQASGLGIEAQREAVERYAAQTGGAIIADYTETVSIGVQTGPPIGAQKGPPFTMAQG